MPGFVVGPFGIGRFVIGCAFLAGATLAAPTFGIFMPHAGQAAAVAFIATPQSGHFFVGVFTIFYPF
jgi:hypothetical protein